MRARKCLFPFLAVLMVSSFLARAQEADEETALNLRIGASGTRDVTLEIRPGDILSASKGKAVTFEKAVEAMRSSRFIFIGETHDSLPMHVLQLRFLQALHARDRNLCIGLEQLPAGAQDVLDKWSLGILTRDEFLRGAAWYVNWNFNFGYYEKIFDFARDNGIPMRALNAPWEIIAKIRRSGWDALGDEEKSLVPRPDLSNGDHRRLIRAIFESTDIPPEMKGAGLDMMFEGLYRSQAAWDEVMAGNTLAAAEREGRRVVVLAGSGHLLYNLGINRRVGEKSRQPSTTVICVTIPKGKPATRVSRNLADYICGIPAEDKPAFPSVGLGLKKIDGLENLVIDGKPKAGAAKAAGFEKGDIVLSVDGKPFADINELRIALSGFGWGREVKFHILRQAQELDIVLRFEPGAGE